jgi:tRNA dimethylallyltransferase
MSALGYGEIVRYLEGEVPLDAALDVMKQKSRNYAKRQLTWFRSMKNTIAVTLSGKDAAHAANEIVECITRQL